MFHFELHNFHATKISSWNLNLAPKTAGCFCRRHVPCLQQRHQNQISCSDSFIFSGARSRFFLNFRARSRSLASATKVPRPTSYRMSQHLRGLITRWALFSCSHLTCLAFILGPPKLSHDRSFQRGRPYGLLYCFKVKADSQDLFYCKAYSNQLLQSVIFSSRFC